MARTPGRPRLQKSSGPGGQELRLPRARTKGLEGFHWPTSLSRWAIVSSSTRSSIRLRNSGVHSSVDLVRKRLNHPSLFSPQLGSRRWGCPFFLSVQLVVAIVMSPGGDSAGTVDAAAATRSRSSGSKRVRQPMQAVHIKQFQSLPTTSCLGSSTIRIRPGETKARGGGRRRDRRRLLLL